MTKLSKPVTRETAILERTAPIVVTLHPRYIEVRLKGTRMEDAVNVPYDAVLSLGRKMRMRATGR
jgi:hypothetical protein